jgi:hypothetical protein
MDCPYVYEKNPLGHKLQEYALAGIVVIVMAKS